jgi:hypothetical protein
MAKKQLLDQVEIITVVGIHGSTSAVLAPHGLQPWEKYQTLCF